MDKRNFIITIVLILIIFAPSGFAADKYQWKLVDTKDGCQIYTSVVAGKEYIASKTTCLIPARMEIIATLIRDIANYPEWMEDCKETKILKLIDDENDVSIFWFRQHITLFSDRDVILKSTVKRNIEKGQYLFYGDLTNEMSYDSGKGYVRMPSFNSLFTLDWIDREHTMVTFMIDPDIGTGVPSSIANSLIKKTPYKSLKKMMKEVKKSNYIESAKKNKYNKMIEDAIKDGFLKP
jgi:hypothetical protein